MKKTIDKRKKEQKGTQLAKKSKNCWKKHKSQITSGIRTDASQGQTQKRSQTIHRKQKRGEQRDFEESDSEDDFQPKRGGHLRHGPEYMEKSQNMRFRLSEKSKQQESETTVIKMAKEHPKSAVQDIRRKKPQIIKVETLAPGIFKGVKLLGNDEVSIMTMNKGKKRKNEEDSQPAILNAGIDGKVLSSTIKRKKKEKNRFSLENFIDTSRKNNDIESGGEYNTDEEQSDSVEPVTIDEIAPNLLLSFRSMSLSQEAQDDSDGPSRELRKATEKNYDERSEDYETVSESSYSPSAEESSFVEENNNSGERKRNCRKRKNEEIQGSPLKKRVRRYVKSSNSKIRLHRKKARINGDAYKTDSGRIMRARQCRKLTPCRMKCSERISNEHCKVLHQEFYRKMIDVDSQRRHLAAYISIIPKKISRISKCSPSKRRERQYTLKYSVSINGAPEKLCKGCFQKIYDVSNTFIDTIVKKKNENEAGIPTSDQRGRHEPVCKISDEKLDLVKAHLLSFPSYQSHYARRDTDKRILPSHYNGTVLYNLYCEKYPNDKVSRWIYDREFHKLNLTFKEPKIDTCKTCDELQKQLEQAKTEFEKSHISEEITCHHNMAAAIYDAKKCDKELAKSSNERIIMATFDMQQCLPTPSLPTSAVFYSRQLWTYNLTCHNCNTGQSHNFMWHEAIASRGANQVASGIFKFLMELPDTVEQVIFYSDSCAGQNKNFIISAMYMYVLQKKSTLKCIEHKFLLPGHTRNECDSDHAAIEKEKKKVKKIHVPRDYYTMIRNMGERYEVIVMSGKHQLNFSELLEGALKKPKRNTVGDKFLFRPVQWMRYLKTTLGLIQYKNTVDENAEFLLLDMRRNRYVPKFNVSQIRGPHPISKEKKKDLKQLLKYIDEDDHAFYENLVTDDCAVDYYDDSYSAEEDD